MSFYKKKSNKPLCNKLEISTKTDVLTEDRTNKIRIDYDSLMNDG
jgi:hypothetical protein